MASYSVNAYGKTLAEIEPSWKWITETQEKSEGKVELWAIEPDRQRNHYVIITRYSKKRSGKDAKIRFLKKIKEAVEK